MASKGQKFKHWSKEEKLRIVKKVIEEGKTSYAVAKEENILSAGMIRHWTKCTLNMEGVHYKIKRNLEIH